MSSIKTYEALTIEEQRLKTLLYEQKTAIKESLQATKKSLNPFRSAMDTAKNLFTRGKTNPLMKFGVDFGVDVIVRRFLLAKAGWFTKIVVPFFVKNYSAYVIKEKHLARTFTKILSYFKDLGGHAHHKADEMQQATAADINASSFNHTTLQ